MPSCVGTDIGCLQLETDDAGEGLQPRKKFLDMPLSKPVKSAIVRDDLRSGGQRAQLFL